MANLKPIDNNKFYDQVSELLKRAKNKVVKSVNSVMVKTYFKVGEMIIIEEQNGKLRIKQLE